MGSRLERRVRRVEMAAGIHHRRIRMIWKGAPLPDDLPEDERLIIVGKCHSKPISRTDWRSCPICRFRKTRTPLTRRRGRTVVMGSVYSCSMGLKNEDPRRCKCLLMEAASQPSALPSRQFTGLSCVRSGRLCAGLFSPSLALRPQACFRVRRGRGPAFRRQPSYGARTAH